MTAQGWLRAWAWVWIPASLFLVLSAWAVTSPIGSAPDDDYHLASIWCAAGEVDGRCETPQGDQAQRLVPANVLEASECYRYKPEVPASCTALIAVDTTMVATDHINQVEGLYPTGYYRVMSLLVSEDVERSVLSMRLLNAALVSLLLALLIRTVPAGFAFAALAAIAAVSVPLGLFILASTNPSGWATAGTVLFWGFALALVHRRDWRSRRTWLIAIGALASAAMAITARVDSAAYLVMAALIVFVLVGATRLRAHLISTAVVAVLALWGAITYAGHGTPGGGEGAPMGTAEPGGSLLLSNIVHLPLLIEGAVGGWALGWLDTAMAPLVPFVGVLVLGGLGWAGLSEMWPSKAVAVTLAALALITTPLWFLHKEGLAVGEVVQPRYLLPLLALLMATLLVSPRPGRPLPLPLLPSSAAAVALTISATVALWSNIHRYARGAGVPLFDSQAAVVWSGPVPGWLALAAALPATVILLLGSLVVLGRSGQVRAGR